MAKFHFNNLDEDVRALMVEEIQLDIDESKLYESARLNSFSPYINKKGMLTNTSGDTYGPNRYSKSFGYSELSQGMLLLLLSKANNKLSL